MTSLDFPRRKQSGKKISMVTCYDATFATLVEKSNIDCVLIGDSCAMVQYGEKTTLPATLAMMARHTKAVRMGAPTAFLVADMPFLAARKGAFYAVSAAGSLLKAGADAVKIEGCRGQESIIRHICESGIPVMAHLGLTPQYCCALGGFKVQGKTDEAAQRILEDAQTLEACGCFALVLECVPAPVAAAVTRALHIPVIGIGAGSETDGQVLVLHDLLGLTSFKPTFVRRYLDGSSLVMNALNQYSDDIASGAFPSKAEEFSSCK